jgi:hypothetical protein
MHLPQEKEKDEMTLLQEITDWFAGTTKWPGGLEDDIDNITLVEDKIVDTGRWSVIHDAVYVRKLVHTVEPEITYLDEYVGVRYREPATEMQDWGDEGPPDIYALEPYEETVIKFRRV